MIEMISDFLPISTIFNGILTKLKLMFGTNYGFMLLTPVISFSMLTRPQISAIVLVAAILFDFATGIWASYTEQRNNKAPTSKSGWFIESAKLRSSVVKSVFYMLFILGSWAMECLFFDKKISFTGVSSQPFTIVEIVIGICIAIEMYSTLFENMKRAGYDIVAKVRKITKDVDSVVQSVKKIGKDREDA